MGSNRKVKTCFTIICYWFASFCDHSLTAVILASVRIHKAQDKRVLSPEAADPAGYLADFGLSVPIGCESGGGGSLL